MTSFARSLSVGRWPIRVPLLLLMKIWHFLKKRRSNKSNYSGLLIQLWVYMLDNDDSIGAGRQRSWVSNLYKNLGSRSNWVQVFGLVDFSKQEIKLSSHILSIKNVPAFYIA